jgi:hypothetical protein
VGLTGGISGFGGSATSGGAISVAGNANGGGAGGTKAGSGGTSGGTNTQGGSAGKGVGGTAAGAGQAGKGGASAAGSAGMPAAGSGGVGALVELARGKPATGKTSQAANPVTNGNDGSTTTRFCAADGMTGNWWRVDLGAVHVLERVEVHWEFARQYGYLIELSSDDLSYSTASDSTTTTSSSQMQSVSISGSARYVRITVTRLPASPPTWMSFFELRVYGR